MYPLFESIKLVDGEIHNVDWHQKRYERSYRALYSKSPISHLINHVTIPAYANVGTYKLRISYNDQYKKMEFDPYSLKEIKTLKMVVVNNINYDLKLHDRTALLDAYKQKESCDDILIIKNDMVTDSSYANIVFYNGKDWVTPNTPLLHGTARARLLHEGIIQEQEINVSDIATFQSFKLINAMRDFDRMKPVDIRHIQ